MKAFRHEPALGQEANRRFCFQHTDGNLVAMLDDDDLWQPEFLERMTKELEEAPEAAFASCGQSVIDADDTLLRQESEQLTVRSGRGILHEGLYGNLIPIVVAAMPFTLGATLFRHEALDRVGSIPEGSGLVCDWALMCSLAMTGARMVFVPDALSLYRVHRYGRASGELAFRRDGCRWARRLALASSGEYGQLLRAKAILSHRDFVMDLAHAGQKARSVREAIDMARTWGLQSLGLRGTVYLPLVLLGADHLRQARAARRPVAGGGLLTAALAPQWHPVSASKVAEFTRHRA